MSLKVNTNCYSFNSFNHLGELDGHYVVLLERHTLDTFAFYKMGGYGSLTWYPPVSFEPQTFSNEAVERIREAILKEFRLEIGRYTADKIECNTLAGFNDKEIPKYWGKLEKYPFPEGVEYRNNIMEHYGEYLDFETPEGIKTLNTRFSTDLNQIAPDPMFFGEKIIAKTPYQYYRQLIKIGKAQGLTYKGRGSFDSWLGDVSGKRMFDNTLEIV